MGSKQSRADAAGRATPDESPSAGLITAAFYRGSYRGHLKFNIDVILVAIEKWPKLPSNGADFQRSNKAH